MWVLSCTLRFLGGCFSAPPVPDENALETLEVRQLRIVDQGGGAWPADAVPRLPRFEVELNAEVDNGTKQVWLVRGAGDEELLADLFDPPLRSASEARLVPARVEARARLLTLAPDSPLPPHTQLTLVVRIAADQAYTKALRVSSSPSAGAALIATLPAAKAHAVPTNLQAILLRYDGLLGPFEPSSLGLHLDGERRKASVERSSCAQLGLGAGDCLRMIPSAILEPNATYVVSGDALVDATFAALPPIHLEFTTGEPDHEPPNLGQVACAIDEAAVPELGCLLASDDSITLRISPNEPVRAELRAASVTTSALSNQDSCVLTLTGLAPNSAYAAALTLTDLAGNTRVQAVELKTRPELARLFIDEVRSDPLGPEPAQEFVELLNSGPRPVSLMGFTISTDVREQGRSITTALSVSPGERVLVVAPTFDVEDDRDGPLPAGVRIARLDGDLALSNAGQVLTLRDAQGARIDVAPALSAPVGHCIARSEPNATRFDRASFVATPCTPGEASARP